MRLVVVVPMYNEELGAERCVSQIGRAIADADLDAALVVVDDGSTDATRAIVTASVGDEPRVELVAKDVNEGYGAALRTGVVRAAAIGAEWVLFMDSDLTNPPAQIAMFAARAGDDVDVIKACRFCAGGGMIDVPFRRRCFSLAGNLVARALGGGPHRDPTNGFRAFRTSTYQQLPLTERGFSVILEEMYHARRLGLRGADLPTELRNRDGNLRPSAFLYSPQVCWAYLRWPLRSAVDRTRAALLAMRSS